MTYDQAEYIIKAFTYKPGWQFIASPMPSIVEGIDLRLIIISQTIDARPEHNGNVAQVQMFFDLTISHMTEEMIIEHVQNIIKGLELHEMDEWLRYDGELVVDPHA